MTLDKKALEHLAKLARLELDPKDEPKLIKDLGAILNHFEELNALDTANVRPMTGGTELKDVFREDSERENTNQGKGKESFPKEHKGFLKVPPVFN